MSEPFLASIQIGQPCTYGRADAEDPLDRPWTSAIAKSPIQGPVHLGREGLAGDGHADPDNHGGRDKAVLAYSADHYSAWRELPEFAGAGYGAFGENLTIAGLDEERVCIGDVWRLGELFELQVSQPRQPCWKLARRWRIKELVAQVQQNGRTGWYLRVLCEGEISAGMVFTLVDRPHSEWTVAAANRVMHHRKNEVEPTLALAALPQLAASWRGSLQSRAAKLLREAMDR